MAEAAPCEGRGRLTAFWKGAAPGRLAVVLVFLAACMTLSAFFPGHHSPDSLDQLSQALTGRYADWHPPLMAGLWGVLTRATGFVESMFLFHMALLTTAGLVWARVFERTVSRPSSMLAPALLATPIVTMYAAPVWKDVGCAYFMLLAAGILGLIVSGRRNSLVLNLSLFASLFFAVGFRWNALFAIMPIVFAGARCFCARSRLASKFKKARPLAPILLAALVAGAVLGLNWVVAYGALDAKKSFAFQSVQYYDFAGMSVLAKKDVWNRHASKNGVKPIKNWHGRALSAFRNFSADGLIYGKSAVIPLHSSHDAQKKLNRHWVEAIKENPGLYLRNRWRLFDGLMDRDFFFGYSLAVSKVGEAGLLGKGSASFFFSAASAAFESILFWLDGWVVLVLLAAEAVVALFLVGRRARRLALAMSGSGILHVAPLYFTAPASDARYLYWPMMCAWFCLVFLVALCLARGPLGAFGGAAAPRRPWFSARFRRSGP